MAYTNPVCAFIKSLIWAWDLGLLPAPGTILDQPARLVAGIHLWKKAESHCDELLINPKEVAEVPDA